MNQASAQTPVMALRASILASARSAYQQRSNGWYQLLGVKSDYAEETALNPYMLPLLPAGVRHGQHEEW